MKTLSNEEIGQRLRDTGHGKSFPVGSERERKQALLLANGAGKRVATRKNGKGFTVYVLE